MRCADCILECVGRSPLGGCPNGEKVEHSQIITTPDTRPYDLGHGPFEKGYQPSAIQDPIKEAAINLVDAVDRYTMGKCLRSELLIKNNELKNLLK